VEQINARSIFRPASGFIWRGGFDWTCNPCVELLQRQGQVYEAETGFFPQPIRRE